jgi:SAM-dependent methyltransferase
VTPRTPRVPRRRRGTEYLDDRHLDPALALRSLVDIRRSNRLFGGRNAMLAELRAVLGGAAGRTLTLLDVGTGAGDIPADARTLANAMGVTLETMGLEWTVPLASAARTLCGRAVTGDARYLPFADQSVDIVTCSQVLHHFATPDDAMLLRELHRVARVRVIVGEIRRSWLAAVSLWLASWPLGFHHVSRHDGVVSVMRGFRRAELAELVHAATGVTPSVADRPGFRVTASWCPA